MDPNYTRQLTDCSLIGKSPVTKSAKSKSPANNMHPSGLTRCQRRRMDALERKSQNND